MAEIPPSGAHVIPFITFLTTRIEMVSLILCNGIKSLPVLYTERAHGPPHILLESPVHGRLQEDELPYLSYCKKKRD